MRKAMLKLFWEILKDERGKSIPWYVSPVGSLLGDLEGKTEDPYADLREKYKNLVTSKLGTSTPYKYNEDFTIDQPDIEKQAEGVLGNYLQNPTTNVQDYSEATKKYSEASKASRALNYENEMDKTKAMYNRLGLVSSTPGLSAQGDVLERQRTEDNLFDQELTYQNLDRTLQAQGLDVSQLNSMLGQASNLGQTQRQSQQYSQTMSMADMERMLAEEMGYSDQAASLLGGNPPTYKPSTFEQLLKVAAQVAPQVATAAVAASDRRLKNNIKSTGKTFKGFKIYTWNWREWVSDKIKSFPTIGLIAQEVKKVKPSAVGYDNDGFLYINYNLI